MSSNANRTGAGRAALVTGLSLLATALLAVPTAQAAEAAEVTTNPTHGYVSDTTARFLGTVNPKGSQIQSCEFEYGTTPSYGESVPCDTYPEAEEAGTNPYTFGAEVEGLAPETTYHFRLVANNGTGGPQHGADRTIATQPPPASPAPCTNPPGVPHPANLPPCWAYELVSPAATTGTAIGEAFGSASGDRAFAGGTFPLLQSSATGAGDTLAFTRTPSGWTYRDLALDPENPSTLTVSIQARSADGSQAIVERCEQVLIACPTGKTEYIRIGEGGERQLLLSTPSAVAVEPPRIAGVSDDLSRVFLEYYEGYGPLLPEDTHTHGTGLYELHGDQLEYLSLDQSGSVLPCGGIVSGGTQRGTGFEQSGVSASGETVAFESPDATVAGRKGCPAAVDVYIRRNGQSTNISAPRPGDPNFGGSNPDEGAHYAGSDREGDIAYFVTKTKLSPSDGDELPDLYRYDLATDTVAPITSGAQVEAAVVSPGGDYVYFNAKQPIGGEGAAGRENLFVWHEGTTRLVLSSAGAGFGIGGSLADSRYLGAGYPSYSPLTPDGRTLLFSASAQLTGQPVSTEHGNPLPQLFRYSLPEESLTCLTCHADGSVPASQFAWGSIGPKGNADARVQSDDGRSVFFPTQESLLPEDTNDGVADVYMWREGRLYLLSGGHAEQQSRMVSTDTSGSSVFFESPEQLVGGLPNNVQRLYEARLDGGFPTPPAPTPCEGEGCLDGASAAPGAPTPTTSSFAGPGNAKPQRHKARHRKRHRKERRHRHHSHQRGQGGRR